jgi:hypothetical protein
MQLLPQIQQEFQLLDEALRAGHAARFDRLAGESMLSAPALVDACALVLYSIADERDNSINRPAMLPAEGWRA